MPFLKARGLVKRYPGVLALDHADGAISKGVVLGLVGKNGAGKSTLIKILGGAVQPDEGEILIDDEPVKLHGAHHAAQLGISVVHQELTDVPNLSVAENVLLGLGYPKQLGAFVRNRALRRRTREVLQLLGVDIDPAARQDTLSVAHRRRVMIARGLATNARLLILDEPTAALTEEEIAHLHDVIRTMRDSGVAVIYVSHRLDEVFSVTDAVGVMRDGKMVHAGPTSEVTKGELISHITGAATAPERRRRRVEGPAATEDLLRVEGIKLPGVVEDVSFALRPGDLLGIAGLIGSGRTELVRLIFGADRRAAGRIFVRGREVTVRSPRDAMAAGIVLLPEDRRRQGAVLDFSVRKNITLATLPRYRLSAPFPFPNHRRERATARDLVDRLGIKVGNVEHPVRYLSGGNQQKVVLAKWLESGADVFIFDEPTAGIDVEGKEEVYRLMEDLANDGKGVIFISSEFTELVGACNRVLVMREGRLVGELEGDAVTDAALVELCYAEEVAVSHAVS
jgi:ABC-type sugar transport system ATPase subunit